MDNNSESWATTIATLLHTFRNALIAITPAMDLVKIGWRDQEAYDDWDDIASTLYRKIVEKSIQHAKECLVDPKLAPYDLLIPSYDQCTYISVSSSDHENFAFVGFSTKEEPFDHVKCVSIKQSKGVKTKILYFPVSECQFSLMLRSENDAKELITNINVEI